MMPAAPVTFSTMICWPSTSDSRVAMILPTTSIELPAAKTAQLAIYMDLFASIRAGKLPCHVMPDGMTVRIADTTAYEPDALIYCGPRLPPSSLLVPNPIIVVEVLSPSPQHIDAGTKL